MVNLEEVCKLIECTGYKDGCPGNPHCKIIKRIIGAYNEKNREYVKSNRNGSRC